MQRPTSIAWACVAASLLAAAGAAETPLRARLVYGGDESAGPYEALDAQKNPRGFNVDLLRALAESSGREVEFRFGAWPAILRQLDAEEVDLVSMAYTDERALDYDFLAETWTLRQVVFFPEDRLSPPHGLDQLGGEMIAVPARLYMHDFLAGLPEAQRPLLRPVAGSAEQVALLRKREVTAVAGNELLLRRAAAQAGLYALGELPVKALSYQLATRKGRRAAFDWLPPALDRLRASGDHARFVERHLSAPVAARASWRDSAVPALIGLAALGLGLTAARAWNRSLRAQVQLRTRELKHNVSLLRSALESTADGLLVVDRAGQVTAFNDRFVQMWGVSRELSQTRAAAPLLGHMLGQLEDPDRFRARLRELGADPSCESR
ncbi:MAG TPA: transporter substrate-binding domain-containing protein, partial [Planctomycetota bacterium]|nr:transporter substrate-binding domain-containing protein [Planctomycetota bacterium]